MASDPLDQLQSMFPSIDGDVIAIIFSESDKDVSSTVEKLLQLVPVDESEREFPSLLSTVQRSQLPHSYINLQPGRSVSGPPVTGNASLTSRPISESLSNATWQNQQRVNRRLQGPTHIPPTMNKRQQLAGNGELGGTNVLGTALQMGQQKLPYQQTYQSKGHGQTNLGKGTAPGNQRRAGGGSSVTGVHSDSIPLHVQTSQQQQQVPPAGHGFYQIGGSAVNSMPSLSALDPSSYFYHQALPPHNAQQQQQRQLQQQYQLQPQSHSHSQFQPQSHSKHGAQTQYRAQQQQQQQQAQRMGTDILGNEMYGYSGMRPNDPFFASWLNSSRQSDFSNSSNSGQFYAQPPGGQQNWPNVGLTGGNTASLQQYQQQQQEQHRVKTKQNSLPYGGSGGYPPQPINSLMGNPSEQNHKSGWPIYSAAGGGSIGEERGKMDAISALLQPERSTSDFGRYGPVQSEPSLSKMTGVHQRHNEGAPANKVEVHRRKTGPPVSIGGGVSGTGTVTSGKGSGNSEVKVDGGSRKLIILRGLPGSGKTTLARSLVGSSGIICSTDDFFMRNGEYVFDRSMLEENHEKNKCKARDAMKCGRSPVIIDNTNTNAWEMKPYVLLAMEHGYAVEILEPDTPWRFKTAELAKRNSHGVPRYSLEKMLERYDHRVTLETIIISQQPERKQLPKQNDSESLRNVSGGSGGQSANTGGQKGGRTTTKVSPPTPRQQQGGGANETDHTHSTHQKQQTVLTNEQNRSGQLSPRPGRSGQRSNDGGGRVSPRPANHRGQRSSKDNSASTGAGRSGNEHHYQQHHHFAAASMSESGNGGVVSVIGEGRPSSDARKKNTPLNTNQQQHQDAHHSNTNQTMTSSSSNKSQNDQFSRGKGKRPTQHQQTGSRNTLSMTVTSNKKRSVSPSRGPSSSKQNSQTSGGRDNSNHHNNGNGYVTKRSGEGKRSRRGTEEDGDDEFLWDSSEETEMLEAGGGDGVRNGPVFMTDKPPKDASFRPVPQVSKVLVNGGVSSSRVGRGSGGGGRESDGCTQQKRGPMFEVWKDSDDEDIQDGNEREGQGEGLQEENPLPVVWPERGQKGHGKAQQALQRTVEVTNINDKTQNGVFEASSEVDVVQAPPSHPWERTQSARDLQDVNDHFTSLIRRVQSANQVQRLSTLTEVEGSQVVINTSDECFNVFTMSSVWGSQSGMLSSKIQLFDSDANSKSRVDRIDSTIKSLSSVLSIDSSESQLEKQKKAQSFYSMLDALTEEMTTTDTCKVQGEENGINVNEHKIGGVNNSLANGKVGARLDEAVQSTQSSLTVQEAIEDESKYPLRNKLIEELLTENTSLRGKSKRPLQSVAEKASDVLETKVDIETLVPSSLSESDIDRGSLPPPVNIESSYSDKPLKGAMVAFLANFSFEQGCNLEVLTDKIFSEEQLHPEQSFSSLQAAFQTVAQATIQRGGWEHKQPPLFAMVGDVEHGKEAENLDDSSDSAFEDPAIVSKVCLEGESDMKQPPSKLIESLVTLKELSLSEGKPVSDKEETKSFSMSSPEQLEPLDVFPSAFDDGVGTSFPLSVASTETANKSQSTSREQTESQSEPNSTPLQSQTPVNEPIEPEVSATNIDDDDNGVGCGDGCGLEQQTFDPLSAEIDEPTDEIASAEDSTLTLSTSEPSLEGYLDWSTTASCVDSVPSLNWESDLLFLTECFPDAEPNYLYTILKMCKGSLKEALSVILVSHSSLMEGPADQSFAYFDSQISTDTTDDASSTISSSASFTEQQHGYHGFGGQQLDSSPEQQLTLQSKVDQVQGDQLKAIFSVGGDNKEESDVQEPVLVPFFDEPQCANDEEIARALQEELDLEASSDQRSNQPAEEAGTSVSELEVAINQRDRSSSHGSDDTREAHGEDLELRLSASLARQLQVMFGPVTDKLPFDGEITDEDLIVLLSERAAHEIYKKWLDTLHAKRIGYRVQSEINMTRDEALARRLQEEEDSKAGGKQSRKKHQKLRHFTEPAPLAVMAADNYRAHHNSSPPQRGALGSSPQTGGVLTDIMGEQMAQQVQEAEVAQVVKEKAAPNFSLKLQLKDLYSQFPSLDQPLVNQTLVNNKFDIEATVAELKKILLHPPPPPPLASQRETTDGRGLPRFNKAVLSRSPGSKRMKSGLRGTGSPTKRKLFKSEGKEQITDGKGVSVPTDYQVVDEDKHQPSYIELRAEAALHAKLRAECFMKAAHARSKKQYEVAQYYAQQGHLHTEKLNEANQRAAEATLKHNFTSSDELDLHGLHVDEAITALEEKLTSCKGSKLRVVTGQGIHSKGKGAKIRPAVINYLQNKEYKIIYDEKNPGVINVKIK